MNNQKSGVELIADERARHQSLGFTSEKDDHYLNGELGIAAACYATYETYAAVKAPNGSDAWPFTASSDNRDRLDRVRKLVIAGALIAADIDRELRLEA